MDRKNCLKKKKKAKNQKLIKKNFFTRWKDHEFNLVN